MFVRTDGNDPVDKESLMMYETEDKAREKSVNKRKGTQSSVGSGRTVSKRNMGSSPFFKKDFIYLLRERKGRREGEKHQCVVASRVPPTGDLA